MNDIFQSEKVDEIVCNEIDVADMLLRLFTG